MYIVEANIGAGKTTFLRLIQERMPQMAVIFEPLHNWQKEAYGQSLLENFYKDPYRWAYTMETLAMVCRVQEHLREQENPNPYQIMERSIYSGHYVFATNDYDNKFLEKIEWNVYLQWFDFLVKGRVKPPQGFIYLKTEPEVAYTRIKVRDRSAESTISFDYIKQINERHEDFLVQKKELIPELAAVPILILDCNEDFEHNPELFAQHAEKLAAFVNLCPEKTNQQSEKSL